MAKKTRAHPLLQLLHLLHLVESFFENRSLPIFDNELWLKSSDQEQWFAWYVSGMVAIGLAASLIMPDTRKYGYLEGSGEVERNL